MDKYFVPYADNSPAAIEIKGHRLLIVSTNDGEIRDALTELGGDEVREVEILDNESEIFANLAARVNGGVVLTPPGTSLLNMIKDLEQELPWIH